MRTPFGNLFNYLDLEKLNIYSKNNSPDKFLTESSSWDCDPTDILCFADIFNNRLRNYEYAVKLYKSALNELTSNPSLIAPDTNMLKAFAACGFVLFSLQKFEESLPYLKEANKLDCNDYFIIYGLAVCNYQIMQLNEAKLYVNSILKADEELIKTFLSDKKIKLIKDLSEKLDNNDERHWGDIEKAQNYHSKANNFYSESNYQSAIENYKSAIELYENNLRDLLPESREIESQIKQNLSLAYLDLSTLYAETKSQPIKQVIALLLKALIYNRDLNDAKHNLLYYMNYVNAFLKTRRFNAVTFQRNADLYNISSVNFQRIADLYNNGYDLLKTPSPVGTSGRNWEGAINILKQVERLSPNLPYVHHLLGLAYEGCDMDELAIDEWIKVYNLDPGFDFEARTILS